MNKYSPEIAGICGLFCGTCPSFPEECEGCLSNRVAERCIECRHGFRACAKKHNVTWCYECNDFPCKRLDDFIPVHVVNGIVHHENIINDLRIMKESGVQNWVDSQVEAHTCAHCGKMIYWHEAHSHTCTRAED